MCVERRLLAAADSGLSLWHVSDELLVGNHSGKDKNLICTFNHHSLSVYHLEKRVVCWSDSVNRLTLCWWDGYSGIFLWHLLKIRGKHVGDLNNQLWETYIHCWVALIWVHFFKEYLYFTNNINSVHFLVSSRPSGISNHIISIFLIHWYSVSFIWQ